MTKRKRKKRDEARRIEVERAEAAGLPPLASIKTREASGRVARHIADGYRRDDAVDSLMVRARQLGLITGTEDRSDPAQARKVAAALHAAKAQFVEGQAGRAIAVAARDEQVARKMRRVWDDFAAARVAYHHRILGLRPQISALQLAVSANRDPAEATTPDTRTEDQKAEAALRAWRFWTEMLGRIAASKRSVLRNAVAEATEFVQDGLLTHAGAEFVAALAALTVAVDRP